MINLSFILRTIKKNPLLMYINVPGLAFGLCTVFLLSLYLKHELSYDKHFPTKDRTVRLINHVTENDKSTTFAISLRKSLAQISENVPEIQASTQIYRGWNVNVHSENNYFSSLQLLFADPGFFDVFGLKLMVGDSRSALDGDKKVVLSQSTAQKIFNSTNCVGQIIKISNEPYVVSGVINDLPTTSHFDFDLLASMQSVKPEGFGGLDFFTYFLINEKADLEEAKQKIVAENDKLMKPFAAVFNMKAQSDVEMLSDIHLYTKADGDLSQKANLTHIAVVACIAFFVLLIALVNYMNLYVLHGEKRISEIATRKSLGANIFTLAKLFYSETTIISIVAFVLAIVVSIVALPHFQLLMQRPINVSDLFSTSGIVMVLAILLLVILVSGAYPTFNLSRINLINALKGSGENMKRKSRLSAITVVVQFSITIFLISVLAIVFSQVNHLKNIPLGFSPENVVGMNGFNPEVNERYKIVKEELEMLPFVENVGSSNHFMGGGCSGQGIKVYGKPGAFININQYRVHSGFCETMRLQLLEGRFFYNNPSDEQAVILNESAIKMLGITNPIGSLVEMHSKPMEIIGVVKDFYYNEHAGEKIAPLVLNNYASNVNVLYLRINGEFTPDKKEQVAQIIKKHDPDYAFNSFALTDIFSEKFVNEKRVMDLISSGTVLAILISFIGLLALSSLQVDRRTKEIGIRKILGSTETGVMKVLISKTLILVSISMVIAFAFTYMIMQEWLSTFATRINLHFGYFIFSGIVAIIVALLAVSWRTWKAATRNPVEALRYE